MEYTATDIEAAIQLTKCKVPSDIIHCILKRVHTMSKYQTICQHVQINNSRNYCAIGKFAHTGEFKMCTINYRVKKGTLMFLLIRSSTCEPVWSQTIVASGLYGDQFILPKSPCTLDIYIRNNAIPGECAIIENLNVMME